MDEIQLEKQAAYHGYFEFKGQELQPFSEGRRMVASAIGVRMGGVPKEDDGDGDGTTEAQPDESKKRRYAPTQADVFAIIFICLTNDKKILRSAHRDPDGFWGLVMDWADANVTPANYEEAGTVAAKLLMAAFANQVEPVPEETDGTAPKDPNAGKN